MHSQSPCGGEVFYQSAYDDSTPETDWGGGNADDEEMFLLALLASNGLGGSASLEISNDSTFY